MQKNTRESADLKCRGKSGHEVNSVAKFAEDPSDAGDDW
jgi:hypothetical protein